MGDQINLLPIDNDPLNVEDMNIVNSIFKENKQSFSNFMGDIKYPVLVGLLFFAVSSDLVSGIIKNVIPYARSSNLAFSICKSIAFAVLYFILINSY